LGLFPTLVKTELCDPPSAGNASAAPAAANANNKQPRCAPKVVPVVQAYYASKYLGHLTIDLDARQLVASSPVLLGGPNSTNPVAPDPSITKLIKAMSGPVQELEARVAGRVDVRVIGGLPGRTRETNFGSLMADIVVRAGKRLNGLEKAFGPVDIGILTGGGIRSDIGPGNVTYGSVMAAMPFGNTLSIKSLTGAQIRAGLLHGLSGMKDTAGRFPQVSGLRMWHRGDALLDAVRLLPGGKTAPLDDAARYNVASTSYILNGGDGYAMFATGPPPIYPSGDPVDELLISALVAARPKAVCVFGLGFFFGGGWVGARGRGLASWSGSACSKLTNSPAPPTTTQTPQIPVPNPAKDRRIIDCAKAYVDCANAELYGPCCTRSG
jgi:2',3'-cyclic-nucleotide 2'-phosphodiesterase (5'-nucleotidase family)